MINQLDQTLYRLSSLDSMQKKLSYQSSSGKKLEQGSDDSVLFSRLTNIDNKIRTFEGLKTQVEKTTLQNRTADSSMSAIKKIMEDIQSELIKANTDTTTNSGLVAIASSIAGMKENIFDLANTQIENEFVFSGSNSAVQPFEKQADGTIKYVGNNELRKVAVEEGSYRERGLTGFDVMLYSSSEASKGETLTFKSTDRIVDQNGNEWIKKASVKSGDKVTFSASQQLVDGDNNTWNLNNSVIPPVLQDANGNTFKDKDGNEVGVTALTDGSGFTLNVPAGISVGINEYVKYDKLGNLSVPEETLVPTYNNEKGTIGIALSSTSELKLSAKTNIFDLIDNVVNALNKVDKNGNSISDDEARKLIGDGLSNVKDAYESVNVSHAKLGGRNKVFETAKERIDAKLTQFNILSQELGAANLTEIAIKTKSLELTYTALYSTINKTNQLSLVNFIN